MLQQSGVEILLACDKLFENAKHLGGYLFDCFLLKRLRLICVSQWLDVRCFCFVEQSSQFVLLAIEVLDGAEEPGNYFLLAATHSVRTQKLRDFFYFVQIFQRNPDLHS